MGPWRLAAGGRGHKWWIGVSITGAVALASTEQLHRLYSTAGRRHNSQAVVRQSSRGRGKEEEAKKKHPEPVTVE
ncbi:hypothetical protein MGYG_04978 [Nannizzia gypsea CBS 118893]|uniref:Uncharacterized protein n=1 Tax=Arthroderma gypseum (strain ATCC MYA-4604 / CBS 118893) TaxID=535722 RepID=E4UXY3_ARTGP|nr:hypothetical protein MGYG_04978 [Nannizzia gypsea CBS 118893]EFR01976.1 hypothetical protein MGYG_04978 [Nannizzia gypsea CBS 118893]